MQSNLTADEYLREAIIDDIIKRYYSPVLVHDFKFRAVVPATTHFQFALVSAYKARLVIAMHDTLPRFIRELFPLRDEVVSRAFLPIEVFE